MCSQFIAMSLRDQLHFVWEKRLCFSCLDGKHTASECKRPSAGYVRGCSGKRCTLLHQSFQGAKKNSGESQVSLMWGVGGASGRFLLCVQPSRV